MTALWLPSSQSRRLSFFDLAAETRNQIYHYLFDDQLIYIREKDDHDEIEEQLEDCMDRDYISPPVKWLQIPLNQAMGLNLLLVSKQCLAEAKPIFLGSATFDIKVDSWSEGSTVKGVSIQDLWQTRFVRYNTRLHHVGSLVEAAESICRSPLATMTGLCKVEIFSSSRLTLIWNDNHQSTLDLCLRNHVVSKFLHRAFRRPGSKDRAAFDHVQKRAKIGLHAEVVLKQCANLLNGRGVSMLMSKIWILLTWV